MPGIARRALFLLLAAPLAAAQTTERASLAWDGSQAALDCLYPAISGDGRFVGFFCRAPGLVPGDTNGANDDCFDMSISGDGSLVAFWSYATNLVLPDSGFHADVFVRDRTLARTERVSVSASGLAGNDDSFKGFLTPDGRFVGFLS